MVTVAGFVAVLLSNVIIKSTSSSVEAFANNPDPNSSPSKEWPERHLPSDREHRQLQQIEDIVHQEQVQHDHEEENEQQPFSEVHVISPVLTGDSEEQQLVGQDYFRTDSRESGLVERLLSAVERNSQLDKKELGQFKNEIKAGDMSRLTGTNWHLHQPHSYPDFGRRFVPQYPYTEQVRDELIQNAEDNSLTPKLASPELVLAVAKESAILAAATPKNPSDELIQKDILRSGNYWNAVWQEDLEPNDMLRTGKQNKMQSVKAMLSPGTELYEIVSKVKKVNPKLLYVINKKNDE